MKAERKEKKRRAISDKKRFFYMLNNNLTVEANVTPKSSHFYMVCLASGKQIGKQYGSIDEAVDTMIRSKQGCNLRPCLVCGGRVSIDTAATGSLVLQCNNYCFRKVHAMNMSVSNIRRAYHKQWKKDVRA